MYRFLLPVLLLVLAACGTTAGVPPAPTDYSNLTELVDVLRRQPGLQITGAGQNVTVQLRGAHSINLDTQPLYVINDVPVGTDYSRANNAVNVQQIGKVEVLRGLNATNSYGSQGANGVIKIYTKSYQELKAKN